MTEWKNAKLIGDRVRVTRLKRAGEDGEICIQHYGESVRVCAFRPGEFVSLPGDTPKVGPERSTWFQFPAEAEKANATFDLYVKSALENGWSIADEVSRHPAWVRAANEAPGPDDKAADPSALTARTADLRAHESPAGAEFVLREVRHGGFEIALAAPSETVVALIDPDEKLADPGFIAEKICSALNEKAAENETRTFELRAEAVACIWEWMVERRDTLTAVHLLFKKCGTNEMRHLAIGLADHCLDVYDAIGGQNALLDLDLLPYDWGFVPAYCLQLDWSSWPVTPDSAEKIAAAMRAEKTAGART